VFTSAEFRVRFPTLDEIIYLASCSQGALSDSEVRRRDTGQTTLNHPLVGELTLRYEKLLRPQARQLIIVYYADQDSPSAERLALLSSL
jgi:hypothetical protein